VTNSYQKLNSSAWCSIKLSLKYRFLKRQMSLKR